MMGNSRIYRIRCSGIHIKTSPSFPFIDGRFLFGIFLLKLATNKRNVLYVCLGGGGLVFRYICCIWWLMGVCVGGGGISKLHWRNLEYEPMLGNFCFVSLYLHHIGCGSCQGELCDYFILALFLNSNKFVSSSVFGQSTNRVTLNSPTASRYFSLTITTIKMERMWRVHSGTKLT